MLPPDLSHPLSRMHLSGKIRKLGFCQAMFLAEGNKVNLACFREFHARFGESFVIS